VAAMRRIKGSAEEGETADIEAGHVHGPMVRQQSGIPLMRRGGASPGIPQRKQLNQGH
jgi:hypothetical protein